MQLSSLETSLEIGTRAEKRWFSFRIWRLNLGYEQPDFPPLWHWLKWRIDLFCVMGWSCWIPCRQICPEELLFPFELTHKRSSNSGRGGGGGRAVNTLIPSLPHRVRAHLVGRSSTGWTSNTQVISQTSHRFKSSTLEWKKNKTVDFFREYTTTQEHWGIQSWREQKAKDFTAGEGTGVVSLPSRLKPAPVYL